MSHTDESNVGDMDVDLSNQNGVCAQRQAPGFSKMTFFLAKGLTR